MIDGLDSAKRMSCRGGASMVMGHLSGTVPRPLPINKIKSSMVRTVEREFLLEADV